MITVFVSYSHRDEEFRNELEAHLAMLKREGLISIWHDRRISAGREVDSSISEELENAQLFLLLVSPYFLASDYCVEREMARALERHKAGDARVIPIIVNPCEWQRAPFGGLRATPTDGRPITKFPNAHDAYQVIVADIRAAIAELGVVATQSAVPRPIDASTQPLAPPDRPRSSNLRLKREFTEHDTDRFLDLAFEYLANFFESSLEELRERNHDIQIRFTRIDARHFVAAVYQQGHKKAACRIWLGTGHSHGILYSACETDNDSSYNECLAVSNDGQMLLLEPMMGLPLGSQGRRQLNQQGAAEHLWAAFISPLQ